MKVEFVTPFASNDDAENVGEDWAVLIVAKSYFRA
jgi:hypothetical protein